MIQIFIQSIVLYVHLKANMFPCNGGMAVDLPSSSIQHKSKTHFCFKHLLQTNLNVFIHQVPRKATDGTASGATDRASALDSVVPTRTIMTTQILTWRIRQRKLSRKYQMCLYQFLALHGNTTNPCIISKLYIELS